MTTAQPSALVLKDEAGNYFLLTEALLEQRRIPEEHKAGVEQLVNDANVSGPFFMSYFV